MRVTLQKKVVVIIVIFSVAIVGILAGIIWPTIRSIEKLNKETQEMRNYLEKKSERASSLRSTLAQIDHIKLDTDTYATHLFFAGHELELITALENMATKNKVVQKINSSNLDQLPAQYINLSLTINGDYTHVLNYLADLEAMPYFITIRQLSLTSQGERGAEPTGNNVQLNLDLSLYANS